MARCELWHARCHSQGRSKQRQFLKQDSNDALKRGLEVPPVGGSYGEDTFRLKVELQTFQLLIRLRHYRKAIDLAQF